jgi:hypothetical protein
MPNIGLIGLQIWLPGGWRPSWNTNYYSWIISEVAVQLRTLITELFLGYL